MCGGGGVILCNCVYVQMPWKCEFYCMHLTNLLNCLCVTLVLCQIPSCDCRLSINYVFVCVCVHACMRVCVLELNVA